MRLRQGIAHGMVLTAALATTLLGTGCAANAASSEASISVMKKETIPESVHIDDGDLIGIWKSDGYVIDGIESGIPADSAISFSEDGTGFFAIYAETPYDDTVNPEYLWGKIGFAWRIEDDVIKICGVAGTDEMKATIDGEGVLRYESGRDDMGMYIKFVHAADTDQDA